MNYLQSQREGCIVRDLAVKYSCKRPLSPTQKQYCQPKRLQARHKYWEDTSGSLEMTQKSSFICKELYYLG